MAAISRRGGSALGVGMCPGWAVRWLLLVGCGEKDTCDGSAVLGFFILLLSPLPLVCVRMLLLSLSQFRH